MSWVIDNSHTEIGFSAKHMMITTVRGRFEKFEGTLNLDAENPEKAVIEGTVYAASVNTREEKRDAHLRSADFFDVEKYPEIKFKSTRVEVVSREEFKVYGNLTIKDTTKEIALTVTNNGIYKTPWGNRAWGLNAEATVNRKDFGLNWNVALEAGGWLVGDQIKISIDVELVEKVEEAAPAEVAAN
jgi:polyisoprenoid-binding protein YceI